MKALELLGRLSLNMCIANPMERIAISGTDVYEAIAELEALQLNSCDGCKYFNSSINRGLCFRLDIAVSKTFCCQGYEAKEQL